MTKNKSSKAHPKENHVALFINALGRKLTLGQHVECALYGGPIEETPETEAPQAKASATKPKM